VSTSKKTKIILFLDIPIGSIGIGVRMQISTSKIKKRTIIVKNWNEKGIRAEENCINPHSKGLPVSGSTLLFGVTILEIRKKTDTKIKIPIKFDKIFISSLNHQLEVGCS